MELKSVLWTTQVMFDLTSQEIDFYFMVDQIGSLVKISQQPTI